MPYEIKLQIMAEVVAKYAEIKASNWYDLRLTIADLPQKMQEENAHVTQVNEMLNAEHYRADTVTEMIRMLIENDDASKIRATGDIVLTGPFVSARIGKAGDIQVTNAISRKFIELNGSPTFPFTFEKTRKRGAQMEFKSGHKELYTGYITNDQVMFTCFIVKRK
jgi:hypothetical protein